MRPSASRGVLLLAVSGVLASASSRTLPDRDWPSHGGDSGHTQFSPLDQINPDNVGRLQVAWTFHAGDARENRSQIQCNPIIVHGVLYATSPGLKVFALDAATGSERWVFDPFVKGALDSSLGVNRGVVYWESGDDQRVLVTAGERLYALDARTGKPIADFGEQGSVSLKEGLGRDTSGDFVLSNTPGAIYKDLLILGTRVSEGPGPAAPGHIRAFDVRTGKVRWLFHTIPWPGEFGYDTWPKDAYLRIGGANAWSGISVDQARGLVFLPTGSAAYDFWGGNRRGANLFADCLLALRADTGERVWHFQFVHHDLWDRDLPAAPVLVTVTHEGRRVDAVAQTTKSGYVFLFDRETGAPLFPIEEHPVPPSDLRGEQAWPTQPLPVKPPPFARQAFTDEEATTLSPASHDAVLERLHATRTGRQFIPPSRQGTIIFPGFDGGAEWGGAAFDQSTGLLYVNANEMAWILTMVEITRTGQATAPARGERTYEVNCIVCHGPDRRGDPSKTVPSLVDLKKRLSRADVDKVIAGGKGVMPGFPSLNHARRADLIAYLFNDTSKPSAVKDPDAPEPEIPFTSTGYNRFFDPDGYPAVKPPWGTLSAIDLNKGEIAWQVPLGELPELTARGIPPTGTENYGGPIVTAGGLVFIGASKDEKFRALDAHSGRVLWEAPLPAGGYATPSTYEVGGRQYVVIAAGGGKMGTRSGDAYVAYALPEGATGWIDLQRRPSGLPDPWGPMQAMVLDAPHRPLRPAEVARRDPGPWDVVVEVGACAVCRTDLHVVDGELARPKLPLIVGHEIVGRVVVAGDSVERFAPGDRVGVPWLGWTCGDCEYCRTGRENLCPRARFTGYQIDGGYAEYATADSRFVFPIPDAFDDVHAAPLLCAGLIGFRALRKAGDPRRLGLYGFGAAAHIIAQVARWEGRSVYAFTSPRDRTAQEFARSLGAAWAGESTVAPPDPLDAAIIFAPVGPLVPQALRAVAPGGTVVCAGIHMSDIPAFSYDILWGERTVTSVANLTRADGDRFFELAPRIPVTTDVERYPLADANLALDRLRRGEVRGAAVLALR